MKIYISQGMSGKTPQEIANDRVSADYAMAMSFPQDKRVLVPKLTQYLDKQPVYSVAKAIEQMDGAELVAFVPDWNKYPNCRLERQAAEIYGYRIVDLDVDAYGEYGCPEGQMSL